MVLFSQFSTSRQKSALEWLNLDLKSAQVLNQARLYIEIQQVVAKILPRSLATSCWVTKLDKANLRLAVPSASHAAKLRQLQPSIIQQLKNSGWQITDINVQIQVTVQYLDTFQSPIIKEAIPLNEMALDAFEDLSHYLKPGPLAHAVAKLLAHHKK